MGALRFKAGVTLTPDPAGARLLGSLDRIVRELPYDLTVTSGSDSHPASDPHAKGRAFDIRTRGLTDDQIRYVLRAVLIDLQDVAADVPTALTTVTVENLATARWFGQWEHPGESGQHLHFQLRNAAVFPVSGPVGKVV